MTYRISLAQVLQLAEQEAPELFTTPLSKYNFYTMVGSDLSDFVINGVVMPTGTYTVSASQLANSYFEDSSAQVFDVLGVQSGGAIVQVPISGTTGTSTLTISTPSSVTAQIGQATPISGIGISDGGDVSGVTFETLVTAKHGVLAAGGRATGSGTASLDIIGSLSDINAALATVAVTESSAGFDTITVGVGDTAGDVTAPKTISVFASGQLSIGGTGGNAVTADTSPVIPFPAATVTEPVAGASETITVTLSNPAIGALTDAKGGSYNAATGVYTDTGSAASVTAALDALTFRPAARAAQPGQTATESFTVAVTDSSGQSATGATTTVTTTETLLGALSLSQQLELIYLAYFNRAADSGGFSFWSSQNTQAQATGQSASMALTNIANSFAPQSETVAIYSFLAPLVSGGTINVSAPIAQAGLTAFIGSVYQNLFSRAADPAGQNYWVGQITSGAVGLGAAALAIANGATGSDAIEVQNKLAVALDFTTRTSSAGLGQTGLLTASFLTAARGALNGVDGMSLNDASVTAGMNATSVYISGAATGHQTAPGSVDPTVITVTASNSAIDPGVGSFTIQFLAGTSGDSLVLHTGGVDQVFGFDPGTDVLDLRSLLSEANVNPGGGGVAGLSNYFTVTDQGTNALLSFDPTGHGGGSVLAVLQGLGSTVSGLNTLTADGAIRIA